jgi:hypothetical protein
MKSLFATATLKTYLALHWTKTPSCPLCYVFKLCLELELSCSELIGLDSRMICLDWTNSMWVTLCIEGIWVLYREKSVQEKETIVQEWETVYPDYCFCPMPSPTRNSPIAWWHKYINSWVLCTESVHNITSSSRIEILFNPSKEKHPPLWPCLCWLWLWCYNSWGTK